MKFEASDTPMPTCQICLRKYAQIKFLSDDISICGFCINALNENNEPAETSYQTFREWLKTGIRNRNLALLLDEGLQPWQRARAQSILDNLDNEVEQKLPNWINRLLADKSKGEMPYKVVRAHRRGLLFLSPSNQRRTYRNNWEAVAGEIRLRDDYQCKICKTKDAELHVHHIIFLSKHGTNQKHNLITLCRSCHQDQHEHEFDPEEIHVESANSKHLASESLNIDSVLNSTSTESSKDESEIDSCNSELQLISKPDSHSPIYEDPTSRKTHPIEIITIIVMLLAFLLVISKLHG